MPSSSQQDSSDDSPELPFAGWPSSSSEDASFQWTVDADGIGHPSEPSETVELYRTVSYVPLAVVLLGLAQLWQVIVGPSYPVVVYVLSALAIVSGLVGVVRRSQALPLEESEAGDEDS